MLLPYNVDRRTVGTPFVTYTLMGLNVFFFLLSICASNFMLAEDKTQGQKEIASLIKTDADRHESMEKMFEKAFGDDESEESIVQPLDGFTQQFVPDGVSPTFELPSVQNRPRFRSSPGVVVVPRTRSNSSQDEESANESTGGETADEATGEAEFSGAESAEMSEMRRSFDQMAALLKVSDTVNTKDGYRRAYQIQHAYDSVVLEPHWSVLNLFAYHVGEKSALLLLVSLASSLFLHANIEHLFGNLLMLWIFGRATEEFLGARFFTFIYFLSGFAATLLQHFMTTQFAPAAMGIPNLGASGAIAGVMGLFMVRYFRTKVRIFYVWFTIFLVASFIAGFLTWILYAFIKDYATSMMLAYLICLGGLFAVGRNTFWGVMHIKSVYVIGVWVVLLNLAPALYQMWMNHQGGGVAYWAHLGGFALGAAYALMIGGVSEGKDEYAVEDAQEALNTKSSDDALGQASALLQKDANNIAAHEIAARAYDRRNTPEMATRHYVTAIDLAWKKGERDSAVRVFQGALEKHPQLDLPCPTMLNLAGQFAQNGMWNEAGALWCRIIEECPETPEAEIAFLRSAQMWSRQFNDNDEATRQLQMFLENYPQSSWRPQAQQALSKLQGAS